MWDMMVKGGWVMIPIVGCSVIALAIIIERMWYLYAVKIDTTKFIQNITEAIRRNRIKEAIEMCDKTPGPIARIAKAGILKHDRTKQEIKEAIEEAGLYEVPKLERHLAMLATIAHISPLLGLLGTVLGMVECFQRIQEKASTLNPISPGDLAHGIWVALITTVAGLIVAIPAFFAYNYLVSKVEGVILDMERSATNVINILSEREGTR